MLATTLPLQVKSPEKPSATTTTFIEWTCLECKKPCIVTTEESRCLCGHRLKQHNKGTEDGKKWHCLERKCECKKFKYIVAQGAWILRCRCKHKAVEHSATTPHGCARASCKCQQFDSTFVCNCDHGWARHVQTYRKSTFVPLETLQVGDPNAIQRGLDEE